MNLSARLSLILAGLMGIAPFLQWKHYYPITDFYTEWVAASIGLCATISHFRRLSELPAVSLIPVLLIALVMLQYLLGMIPYPEQTLLISLYLLWASLIAMLGYALRQEFGLEKTVSTLAWFILAGGLLSSFSALSQHYHIHTVLDPFVTPDAAPTVYGNLAQQNHFSDYACLAIASLLYLSASKRMPWFFAPPLSLPLLFTLALSGSRSAWLYLGAITVSALLLYRKERNGILLFGALLLIPAFAMMQGIAHLSFFGSGGITTSNDRLLVIARDSGIRLYLWKEAWLMFLDAPWLGVGFGQFAWHHFEYGPFFKNPQITGLYTNAHDISLHLLAETGFAGASTVFGGLVFWARRIEMKFDIHAWWVFALLSVLLLHSLDEYPLWYAQFLGLFMLLLGMGESRSFRLPLTQAALAFFLVSGSYLMTGLMRDYLHLEALLYPGYHDGKPPLRPEVLYAGLYGFRKGTLLAPYVEFPIVEMMSVDGTNIGKKLEMSRRAVRFSPSGMIVYRHAAFLTLGGKEKAAELEVERAASSDPELLGEAHDLYAGLAAKNPEFGPLVEKVNMKLKERNIAFHYQ